MPQNFRRIDTEPVGAKHVRVKVYDPALGVDTAGGVIRNPGGVGRAFNATAPPDDQFLFADTCTANQYGGQGRNDARREVSENYMTFTMHWHKAKFYRAGLVIYIPNTQELWEIKATNTVNLRKQKVIITAKQVT